MRFGCCINMVASGPDGIGAEHLCELEHMGYDYVEMPLAEMMGLDEQKFLELRKKMDRLTIGCEVCNNFFPKHIRLTGQKVHMEMVLSYAEKALTRANVLGASCVVFGSGAAKNVPDGTSLKRGYQQVAELLNQIAPLAAERDIVICIEPLRKQECNLINTFDEGVRLADEIGHPNIKVLADYFHMMAEAEPMSHLCGHGGRYLAHVHFSSSGRKFPGYQDEAEYHEFFNELKKIGYDSRISCEAYSGNFMAEAPMALGFLKHMDAIAKGGDGSVQQGID